MMLDSSAAIGEAKRLRQGKIKGKLMESVTRVMMIAGDPAAFDEVVKTFDKMPFSQSKFNLIQPLSLMLLKIENTDQFKRGVDLIVEFRDQIPADYGVAPYINNLLNTIAAKKQDKVQGDYIKQKLSEK
jgi:aminopeptidase N